MSTFPFNLHLGLRLLPKLKSTQYASFDLTMPPEYFTHLLTHFPFHDWFPACANLSASRDSRGSDIPLCLGLWAPSSWAVRSNRFGSDDGEVFLRHEKGSTETNATKHNALSLPVKIGKSDTTISSGPSCFISKTSLSYFFCLLSGNRRAI